MVDQATIIKDQKFSAIPVPCFLKVTISVVLLLAGSLVSSAKGPAFEVIALGTGGPGAAGRASSSYALVLDGKPRILVDAGGGAFARAGESTWRGLTRANGPRGAKR
jgi:hypothetical protein